MNRISLALLVAVAAVPCAVAQYSAPTVGTIGSSTASQANAAQQMNASAMTAAQAAAQAQVVSAGNFAALGPNFHLSTGEIVTVMVYGQPEFTTTARIDESGRVRLPMVGLVPIAGLNLDAAQSAIAKTLVDDGIYRDPFVTLSLTAAPNEVATVYGELKGVVPVLGQRRLIDVLAALGGLSPTASHVVQISRAGEPQPIVIDLGLEPALSPLASTPVLPGDLIVVGRAGTVFMVGAFNSQGALPLNGNTQLTMMQASALSGGPATAAKMSDMRLIRTINGQRTVVKLDIQKILYGKAPDPILESGDIVFLPTSTAKMLLTSSSTSAVLSAASLALSAYVLLR